jgi:DNA ligase 1
MSTKPLAEQVVTGANGAEAANANHGAIRPRDSLFHWCGTADSISGSPKDDEKRALLEAYFGAVADESIAPAARFFCGKLRSPTDGRVIHVDPGVVANAIQDLGRISSDTFRARYVEHGDLADAAAEVFAGRLPSGVSITEVESWFMTLAGASEVEMRRAVMREIFSRVSSLEAEYLVRLLTGTLAIGVDEALVESALSKAFAQPVEAVHRATAIHSDIGEAATRARRRTLDEARPAAT